MTTDLVRVSTRVDVALADAFSVFTEEVDSWWLPGPRFRWFPERGGRLCFEAGAGGRFVEVYEGAGAEPFEVGRIEVWEPPHRLVFDFRARSFEPGQKTRVEVRFEADEGGSRVTVEHSGWDAFAEEHPVRHGMDADAFGDMMGIWWADLLNSARRRAALRSGR